MSKIYLGWTGSFTQHLLLIFNFTDHDATKIMHESREKKVSKILKSAVPKAFSKNSYFIDFLLQHQQAPNASTATAIATDTTTMNETTDAGKTGGS